MSKTLAAVIALVLVIPILVLIALTSVGGVDSSFLTGTLTFTVVAAAIVAMLFEIKRWADS